MGTAANAKTRGANNIQAKKLVIDMSEKISMLRPSASPLIVLSKRMGSDSCSSYKFEWMEDDLMARWVTNTAQILVGDTTLTIDDSSVLAVDDLLKVPATGEIMKVATIASGTSITVTRSYGETAASGTVAVSGKLVCMGNAIMQGDGIPGEKYNVEAPQYNYTQIFRTPFSVTNTLNAMKLYGKKELAIQRVKKGIEHAVSMEYAFLFGERKLDVSGNQPRTMTAGVLKFLVGTTNAFTKALTSTTEDDFNAWCESIFTYGSETKIVLCSPNFISFINKLAKGSSGQLKVENGATTYGLAVMTYVTAHGTLKLVKHPLLINGYAGYGIVLDMEEIKYRALRDTKLETNRQNNDVDGIQEEYITEAGLELRCPKKHGLIILT